MWKAATFLPMRGATTTGLIGPAAISSRSLRGLLRYARCGGSTCRRYRLASFNCESQAHIALLLL